MRLEYKGYILTKEEEDLIDKVLKNYREQEEYKELRAKAFEAIKIVADKFPDEEIGCLTDYTTWEDLYFVLDEKIKAETP